MCDANSYSVAIIDPIIGEEYNLIRTNAIAVHSARLQASLRLSLISLHSTDHQSLASINYCFIEFTLYSFLAFPVNLSVPMHL